MTILNWRQSFHTALSAHCREHLFCEMCGSSRMFYVHGMSSMKLVINFVPFGWLCGFCNTQSGVKTGATVEVDKKA